MKEEAHPPFPLRLFLVKTTGSELKTSREKGYILFPWISPLCNILCIYYPDPDSFDYISPHFHLSRASTHVQEHKTLCISHI
jgi:hypothetical protein